ncbi:MAG: response regulator [Ardenticatenaceae bacterium]|nr:response regulator [Ardenticatenaceae bacterium]
MSKLLVVEDDDMIQEILVERLLLRDFEVVTADNGEDALSVAQQEQPDLILMDMSLPFLDGLEATRRLRAMDETHHIPIIALTAHAMKEDREKSLAAGCDEFETKPINFSQLMAKINALLDNH